MIIMRGYLINNPPTLQGYGFDYIATVEQVILEQFPPAPIRFVDHEEPIEIEEE